MIKLITIDIDGTLLNSYGEVTDENKKAIQKALEKNIDVVLTSGRMPKSILPIANEINSKQKVKRKLAVRITGRRTHRSPFNLSTFRLHFPLAGLQDCHLS